MPPSATESKRALANVIERIKAMTDEVEEAVQERETCTRYAVIDPILWALGWKTWIAEEVRVEHQRKRNSNDRVDYALLDGAGAPAVLVEAKTWGKYLDKHVKQIGRYARGMTEGVACVTDGWEWWIYDLSQRGRFQSKKVAQVNILEDRNPAYTLNRWLRRSRWW